MTAEELAELNAALEAFNGVVRAEEQDGVTVYYLYRLTRVQKIDDPVTFAATYGVTVAP